MSKKEQPVQPEAPKVDPKLVEAYNKILPIIAPFTVGESLDVLGAAANFIRSLRQMPAPKTGEQVKEESTSATDVAPVKE